MPKKLLLFLSVLLIFSCSSNSIELPEAAKRAEAEGRPRWATESPIVFSSSEAELYRAFSAGKGTYASGNANYGSQNASAKVAQMNAESALLQSLGKSGAFVRGLRQVDSFLSPDGTVYVLMFISEKDLKSLR